MRVGDVLLIQPDEAGVANDAENGYTLGINVVEVIRIVTKSAVEVSYMFAKHLEGPWQRWFQKGSGDWCALNFLIDHECRTTASGHI